ncbi:hypothetical protein C8Q80DRAFT_1108543 [Daedaleopsis nitida]|nr:hypothetical protein C8Q80DRAFT_1108543 [Daedaleopsis nitida]
MAEDGQPPAKRSRYDSTAEENSSRGSGTSSHSTAVLERDNELWLDDGNIVLVAGGVGFRVYKGLLAAQSPVLCDMFGAGSLRADEQYDNVPVVPLFDSPIDLRHLLRVLLPKSQRFVMKDRYDHKTEFHIMSALIRLAHKYQIDDVEKRAISALCSIYTTDLTDWFDFVRTVSDDDSCAIAAVNLARLTETPTSTILPSALFNCVLLTSDVLDGYTREDGSVEYLSQDDLKRCIDAAPELSATTAGNALGLALHAQGLRCSRHRCVWRVPQSATHCRRSWQRLRAPWML